MANISTGKEPRRCAKNESIDWPVDSNTSGPPELRRFIDFLRRLRLPGRLPSEPLLSGREGETRGELDNPILESYGSDERLALCFRPFVLSGPVATVLKRALCLEKSDGTDPRLGMVAS